LRILLEKSHWLFDERYELKDDPALELYQFIATGKSSRAAWTWLLRESDQWMRVHLVEDGDLFSLLDSATKDRLSRDRSPLVRAQFLTGFDRGGPQWWPKTRRYSVSLDGFADVFGLPDMPDIEGFGDGEDLPDQSDIRRFALETGWSGTLGELINLVRAGTPGVGTP
jgi:hypothetical protein